MILYDSIKTVKKRVEESSVSWVVELLQNLENSADQDKIFVYFWGGERWV